MSLYSDEPSTELSASTGRLQDEKLFHIGFMVLGVSGLLRVAEILVRTALDWNRLRWPASEWVELWLSTLLLFGFSIASFRYFSHRENRNLLWIPLACTAVGWIAYIAWYFLVFVVQRAPDTAILISYWLEIVGRTGAPVECLIRPFLRSRDAFHFYFEWVVEADYLVRTAFLVFCFAKIRETRVNAAQRVQQRIAQGLGASAGTR